MAVRPDISLTAAEQATWLDTGHTMILSTVGADGFPHSVAMWYVMLDGKICFSTYGRSQKTVNAERHPKVACLLEDGRGYDTLRGLMIRGTAEIDPDLELNARVQVELFKKYVATEDTPLTPEIEAVVRGRARKRVVLKVTPVKVASWDHGKAQ